MILANSPLYDYIADTARRKTLAARLATNGRSATSVSMYLWQIATGWRGRKPSLEMSLRIERATDGAVTVADLRPDIASALRHPPSHAQQEAA